MRDLTEIEIKIYDTIIELNNDGEANLKDIIQKTGFSENTVREIITELKKFGEIYESSQDRYRVLR